MNKLLLILLFPLSLQAQNTVSLTIHPVDMGIGIKYDRYIRSAGLYIASAYGNYRLGETYIKDHYRFSGGVSILADNARFSAGIIYHRFGEVNGSFNDTTLDPVSFELGIHARSNRFNAGLRYDIIKHESCIDIGVNF